MTQEAAELLKKALSLPVSERADLAGSFIESLEETHDASVEAAWDEEVQRRMADIDPAKSRQSLWKKPAVASPLPWNEPWAGTGLASLSCRAIALFGAFFSAE